MTDGQLRGIIGAVKDPDPLQVEQLCMGPYLSVGLAAGPDYPQGMGIRPGQILGGNCRGGSSAIGGDPRGIHHGQRVSCVRITVNPEGHDGR